MIRLLRRRFSSLPNSQGKNLIPNEIKESLKTKIESETPSTTQNTSSYARWIGLSLFGIATGGTIWYAQTPYSNIEKEKELYRLCHQLPRHTAIELPSKPSFQPLKRLYYKSLFYYKSLIDRPQDELLLPSAFPVSHPRSRKQTLVLSLDRLLVNCDWDQEKGWLVKKRPWADYFLSYLSELYEIVIFCDDYYANAIPILEKLDTNGAISYKLFRDSCSYDVETGFHYKDLELLNRNMKNVVYLTPVAYKTKRQKRKEQNEKKEPLHVRLFNKLPFKTHLNRPLDVTEAYYPNNTIAIPEFKGGNKDSYLLDLIPFLETLVYVDDVRPVIEYYSQLKKPGQSFVNIPKVFSLNVKKGSKKLKEQQADSDYQPQNTFEWFMKGFLSLFGLGIEKPIMPLEQQQQVDESDEMQMIAKQHQHYIQEMENFKKMHQDEIKRAEQEHLRIMEKAKNIRITLWDMIQLGPEEAIISKADPELKEYFKQLQQQQQQQLQPQQQQQ